LHQVAPLLAGLAVAAAAYAGKYSVQAWQAFKASPPRPRMRKFYDGGFQPTMTKREAALILGIRYVSPIFLQYMSCLLISGLASFIERVFTKKVFVDVLKHR
jgi:hypothetical protein